MKHTRLFATGIAALITIGSVATVFAAETDKTGETITMPGLPFSSVLQNGELPSGEQPDVSSLELPEGFTAFDSNNVPDGTAAPANGELKTLTEEEIAKITSGELPELPSGELPELSEEDLAKIQSGELPELPTGEQPDVSSLELPEGFTPFDSNNVPDGTAAPANGELKTLTEEEIVKIQSGELPELPSGEQPTGELPELPSGAQPTGELPELPNGEQPTGELPELPSGEQPTGELPELPSGEQPTGELPELPSGEMPQMTQGSQPQMPGFPPQMPGTQTTTTDSDSTDSESTEG